MTRRHPLVAMHRQRGAALLAIILLAVIAIVAFILANLQNEHRPQKRAQAAAEKLAEARDALLGMAVVDWCTSPAAGQTPQYRLPCPLAANGAPNCAGGTPLGRFPWTTANTGPLRDSAGECLWYQRQTFDPMPGPNTEIARLFAPGEVLPGQTRPGSNNGECGNHGNPNNYLDSGYPAAERNDTVLTVVYAELQAAAGACPAP